MTNHAPKRHETVPRIVPRVVAQPANKRKRRNTHRGVYILKPEPPKNPYYRLRYRDPDTGKTLKPRIPDSYVGTVELRNDYAQLKYDELQSRKREIRGGAEPRRHVDGSLKDAVESYFTGFGMRRREGTQRAYRRGANAFLRWCALPAVGIRSCRQLTPSALRAYAAYAAGLKLDNGATRAATTVNRDFRWLSPVLNELARAGRVALTHEQIKASLRPLRESKVKKPFLRSPQLRAVLDAARDYDRDANNGPLAGRLRQTLLFVLLTGARPKEALAIGWDDLVTDDDGNLQIRVRAEFAKTGVERRIPVKHSPLLQHLVSKPGGRTGSILGGTADALDKARWLLAEKHGAPDFDCKALRRTCGSYLASAAGINGNASVFMTAMMLGHSITTAQKYYYGAVAVPPEASTLEAAMKLEITPADCRPL